MRRLQLTRRLMARARRLMPTGIRGSILPLFAFAMLPLTFATGMSIDYAKAMRMQTKLRTAADAAAIAAVSKQVMNLTRTYGVSDSYSPDLGKQFATRLFKEAANRLVQSGGIEIDLNDPRQFEIKVEDNDAHTSRTAVVTFKAQSPNAFAKILNWASLPIGGMASSTVSAGLYTDMYVVLDTSQSMGLAATDEDARKLFNGSQAYNGEGCTFGCHSAAPYQRYANDWVAKQVGAKLRLDILREATLDMVDTAIDAQGANSIYRFGLYRLGAHTTDIKAVTNDLGAIKQAASTLTLGPTTSEGDGDTNFKGVTDSMMDRILNKGDGKTRNNPRSFLFIVTDGVFDVTRASGYGGWCKWANHCTGTIDPKDCDRYKDANVTVAIVYTTYKRIYQNPLNPGDTTLRGEYTDLVIMHEPSIEPNLRACASKGWFFEASDGPSIHKAMQQLFSQALQTPILTQ